MRREDVQVLADCDESGDDEVRPEGNLDRPEERRRDPGEVGLVGDEILVCAGDERRDAEEETGEEKPLAPVGNGGFERPREEAEAREEERGDQCEEEDVEDVDGEADLEEPGEVVRLGDDQQGDSAGGHGERVPRPGEVAEALPEGEAGAGDAGGGIVRGARRGGVDTGGGGGVGIAMVEFGLVVGRCEGGDGGDGAGFLEVLEEFGIGVAHAGEVGGVGGLGCVEAASRWLVFLHGAEEVELTIVVTAVVIVD